MIAFGGRTAGTVSSSTGRTDDRAAPYLTIRWSGREISRWFVGLEVASIEVLNRLKSGLKICFRSPDTILSLFVGKIFKSYRSFFILEHMSQIGIDDSKQVSEDQADNLSELFNLHEWVVKPSKIDISEVFGKTPEHTVAFEVALAAIIGTIIRIVSTDSDFLNHLALIGAIGLLFLSLLRRISLDMEMNGYSDFTERETGQWLMRKTTRWMQYLILYSIIYAGISFSEMTVEILSGDILLVLSSGIFLFTIGTALLYEYVIGDFLFYGAIVFYNQFIPTGPHSLRVFGWKIPLNFPTLVSRLHQISPHYSEFNADHTAVRKLRFIGSPGRQGSRSGVVPVLIGMVVGVAGLAAGIMTPIYSLVTGNSVIYIIVLIMYLSSSAIALQGLLQFILSRYGNADLEDMSDARDTFLPVLILLATTLAYRIHQTGFPKITI